MIINSIIFNDEFQVLMDRLRYEIDFYDLIIITEATSTFSGLPKPLYFERYKDKLPCKYLDKICYLVIHDLPKPLNGSFRGIDGRITHENRWPAETYMRNYLTNSLSEFPADSVFVIQDADEIANINSVKSALHSSCFTTSSIYRFSLHQFSGGILSSDYLSIPWYKPFLVSKKTLADGLKLGFTPNSIRKANYIPDRQSWESWLDVAPEGFSNLDGSPVCKQSDISTLSFIFQDKNERNNFGWHLKSMHRRDRSLLNDKVNSFAHSEFSNGKSLVYMDSVEQFYSVPLKCAGDASSEMIDYDVSAEAPAFIKNSPSIMYYI